MSNELWAKPAGALAADGSGELLFFWGKASPYSNWRIGRVEMDGFRYCCGEQRMMHCKAAVFGDRASADAIMAAAEPSRQKSLGRAVSPYDDALWAAVRYEMMVELAYEKAMQDGSVKGSLLSTGSARLVEASPFDPIWGIGLGERDPRALDPSQWLGLNLLGRAWDDARELIRRGLRPPRSRCSRAVELLYGARGIHVLGGR